MRPEHDQDRSLNDVLARAPSAIFKFSGLSGDRLEWMRRLIVENELYFPSPGSFNDPLDCRVTPRYEVSVLAAEKHWRDAGRKIYPNIARKELKKRAKQMARRTTTPEGQAEFATKVHEAMNRNGTACFAPDPTNVLLWSYYAEGHAGVAVRFCLTPSCMQAFGERLQAQGTTCFPIEVEYRPEFPSVNYYSSPTHEVLKTILGTKALAWQHEAEWRIVLPNRTGYLKIPRTMITGIVFGMRLDASNEQTVRQWVAARGGGIELLRVTNKPGSFVLQLEPA